MIEKLSIFKNKSLNTFLKYSLKYKWVMTAVVFTSAVSSAMGAVPAWLSKYLIDDVLVNKNARMMALVIGGIFVSTILKVVTGYFSSISSNYVTETIKRDIKIDVYLDGLLVKMLMDDSSFLMLILSKGISEKSKFLKNS